MCGSSFVARVRSAGLAILTLILITPTLALAQSPWERAANNLATTFTGPLARSLALVFLGLAAAGFLSAFVAFYLVHGRTGPDRRLALSVFRAAELALSKLVVLAALCRPAAEHEGAPRAHDPGGDVDRADAEGRRLFQRLRAEFRPLSPEEKRLERIEVARPQVAALLALEPQQFAADHVFRLGAFYFDRFIVPFLMDCARSGRAVDWVPGKRLFGTLQAKPDMEFERSWLDYCELYNAPAEEQVAWFAANVPAEHDALRNLVRSHRGFERVKLTNLTEEQAATFAVRRHLFSGVDIQVALSCHYPFGDATSHAIGYVGSISEQDLQRIDRSNYAGTSHIGKTGIERAYEDRLHGQVGYRQLVVNAQGRVLDVAGVGGVRGAGDTGGFESKSPSPGENLVLSLDMKLQLAAQEALADTRGAVVAIDPRNGDVLALVSTPAFDPNRFAAGMSRRDFVALNTDPDKPLFNRALAGTYPPGSTVKPFIALTALQHEAVAPEHEIYCPGEWRLPGQTHRYREGRGGVHGNVDLHVAIVRSCDVYFYQLAVAVGIDHLSGGLAAFGFGAPTGLDISGEQMTLIHDGPTYAEPHDALMIRADQLNPSRLYSRDDPYFAETVAMARADGVELEKENRVVRDGNKVRVYMTSVAPNFGLTEFRVKQGDEVTLVVTNLDTIEDVSHGFALVNHGINFEIHPQQTSSVTLIADKPGVHWLY